MHSFNDKLQVKAVLAVAQGVRNRVAGRKASIRHCDGKSRCLPPSLGKATGLSPGMRAQQPWKASCSTMVNLIELGWPATITITTMIIAVPVVIHVSVARGVDRSVPIIANEIDLSLACIVAAAIGSPILALIGWNPQVHWLIILRAQRLN